MTTEVATTQTKALTTPVHTSSDFESDELEIPRLSLVQDRSHAIKNGLAKEGDIIETLENKVVASMDKPLFIIPLKKTRVWLFVSTKNNRQVGLVPFAAHPTWTAYSVVTHPETGEECTLKVGYDWDVLLYSEAKAGNAFPYRLRFKGMSLQAAKKMHTVIAKSSMHGGHCYNKTFKFGVIKESDKNNNEYVKLVLLDSNDTEQACLEASAHWSNTLKSSTVVTDEGHDD